MPAKTRLPRGDGLGGGLAREPAEVDLRVSVLDATIDGEGVAGEHLDVGAPRYRLGGHDAHAAAGVELACRARGQRLGRAGGELGFRLLPDLHEAGGEQHEHERAERVEVDLPLAAHEVEEPPQRAQHDAQAQRQIHVWAACAQRAERTAVEDARGPGHRWQRHQRAEHAEVAHVLRVHVGERTAVECQRKQHAVACGRPGHAQPGEQVPFLEALQVRALSVAIGVGRVAQAVQRAGDGGSVGALSRGGSGGATPSRRGPLSKGHPGQATRIIEATLADSRHQLGQLLHEPDARGAVHALEQQLQGLFLAVALRMQREEAGVVELGVVSPRRERGRRRQVRAAVLVVAVERVLLQHAKDDAAARTAEAMLRRAVDEVCGHGLPAMVARRRRDGGRAGLRGCCRDGKRISVGHDSSGRQQPRQRSRRPRSRPASG